MNAQRVRNWQGPSSANWSTTTPPAVKSGYRRDAHAARPAGSQDVSQVSIAASPMPQSWWCGRAEKRCGPEDDAFRLIAHGRPGENDMLTCAGYVCNVLILVRITSQDLVLHSSACG